MPLERIIEAEDAYTHGHSERVTRLSLAVADELDLRPRDRAALHVSALLHDIGKVAVPGRILNKPGKLTDEEFDEIRKHPRAGADLVRSLRRFGRVLEGILCHHERFDGTGYPNGISGARIPLIARVISVADAFDAMTSDRPYRRGFSASRAVAELNLHRGTQFDAAVVDGFNRAYRCGRILPLMNPCLCPASPIR
jgi:putative nucleotidyltransferase with HDIG domain